jgi:hypothetical protein
MSTSFEKIFNEATILQSYVLEINDYQLFSEDILSLELLFAFNKPFIEGSLSIKDSLGISNLNLWDGNTKVKIYAVDIYGEKFSRVFRITGISNDEYLDRFKKYNINLVDELYYTLANTYLSKSFTEDPVSAFKKYMTELSLDTYLTDNKMTGEYDSADSYSFVVPQDRSIYDFFSYEFKNNGLRFWQSRKSLNVKNITIADLEYVQYEDPDAGLTNARYSNNSDNDVYGFKIHDFKLKYNEIIKSNVEKPVILHQTYDITKKAIDSTTNNLSDIYSGISLNDKDMSTLQHTTGARYEVDADVFIDKQKLELEDIFMRNNSLEIVVPGNFKYNAVGYLAEVNLKGNPLMQSQSIEGDVFHSGKYIITKITDRYVGDKLIQKMVLNRVDFQEPREV